MFPEKTPKEKMTLESAAQKYDQAIRDADYIAHSAFGEREARELLGYLSSKGSRHRNYRHYATRDRIQKILTHSAIYLTDGSTWNDKLDRNRFNTSASANKHFGVCLSSSSTESIAMWMLYGGYNRNGAMINFSQKILSESMDSELYDCGYFDEAGFNVVCSLNKNDLSLQLIDVLYFQEQQEADMIQVSRAKESKSALLSKEALRPLQRITKHESWSYEEEVRLVASVSKLTLAARETEITCIKIPLSLNSGFIKTRILDSPVSDSKGSFVQSALRGTVDWDLCAGCTK